jgi:hypothetical protein
MAQDDEVRGVGAFFRRPRHPEHDDTHKLLHELREVPDKLNAALGRLERIEKSAGRTERSVGASQGALERMIETMARTAQEWDAALDSLQTAVVDAVTAEAAQIRSEIERLKGMAGPDLEPQFNRVAQMTSDMATKIGSVWEAEAPPPVEPEPTPEPVEPPVEPTPENPSEARRRR